MTPLIFLSVTLFMMYYLVVNRPLQSLAGFAMMLVGLDHLLCVPPAIECSLLGCLANRGLTEMLHPA